MKRRNRFYFLFVILPGLVGAQAVHAGQFEAVPSLGIGSSYSRDDRRGDDVDLSLSPALSFQWANPSGQLGFNYGASVRGDLDQGTWRIDGRHRLQISNQTAWTPRLRVSLSGDLTASPDETRGDFNDLDYGEVLIPETDTLHWGGRAVLAYQSSPLRSNAVGFSYGESRYEDPQLNDASWYGVSLSQSRQLAPLASVQVSYRLDRSDLADSALHGFDLSYSRAWNETLSTTLYSGIAYDPRHERRDFDATYGLSGTKTFGQGSVSFSAGNSQGDRTRWSRVDNASNRGTLSPDPSANPGLSERGNLRGGGFFSSRTTTQYASLAGRLDLWNNLEGTWRGSANRTRSFDAQRNQATTYTADIGLHYRISSRWGANVNYQHIHQKIRIDRPASNPGAMGSAAGSFDSDRVSASLTWRGIPWK